MSFSSYGPFFSGTHELQLSPCITVLIGRNNCGKSSLVDLLCDIYESNDSRNDKGWPKRLILNPRLDEDTLRYIFPLTHLAAAFPATTTLSSLSNS